jgi:hypothetical protein
VDGLAEDLAAAYSGSSDASSTDELARIGLCQWNRLPCHPTRADKIRD